MIFSVGYLFFLGEASFHLICHIFVARVDGESVGDGGLHLLLPRLLLLQHFDQHSWNVVVKFFFVARQ